MKKNLFKSVFILVFIASLGFYACSEDATNTEIDEITTAKSTIAVNPIAPVAYVNRLEYIGIEHNAFMEVFTEKLEESYRNRLWNRATFLSDNYKLAFARVMNDAYRARYTQTNSTIDYQLDIYNQVNLDEWFDNDATTSVDLARNVLNQRATNKDKQFTLNLLNDLFIAAATATSNTDAFRALRTVVRQHEALILSENWADNEDYALGALAVAKYSTIFWENYDFSVFTSSAASENDINPRSGLIVGADTAGYVVGGVVGGTGGSFAGPAGTVGGVLGGKATGAWVGSGAAAAAVSIYDAFVDFFD